MFLVPTCSGQRDIFFFFQFMENVEQVTVFLYFLQNTGANMI